jgi:FG-GAP repeat
LLGDGDWFGSAVTVLSDIDGDKIADLAVGAMDDDDGGSNRGAVYVLFCNWTGDGAASTTAAATPTTGSGVSPTTGDNSGSTGAGSALTTTGATGNPLTTGIASPTTGANAVVTTTTGAPTTDDAVVSGASGISFCGVAVSVGVVAFG